MKRFFLILFMAVSLPMCFSINAQEVIVPLKVEKIVWPIGSEKPSRNPVDIPTVYINDYTLTFEINHPEYVLYIKDEYETVVYSTVVTSAMTEVMLPYTLSGDYEIDLIWGNWCFWGWIEL